MNQSFEESNNNNNFIESTYYLVVHIFRAIILNIKKNIGLFLLCLLLPLAFFVASSISKKTVYTGTFTVMYDDLTRKIYGDRIEKLNELVRDNQHQTVSLLLGIKPEEAKRLREIKGKNILGQELTEDLNTDKIPFMVTIVASDSTGMIMIQDRLVEFLETGTQYLANRKALKAKEIQDELNFIDRQLAHIDSLERKMNSIGDIGGESAQDGDKGTNSIFESSYELYKKKQELERRRSVPTTLHVVDDIIIPVKTKVSLVGAIAKGIIIGIFLYAIIVLLVIPVFRFRDAKNI
ncbi:MAG: hypothetical protein EOP56_10750 [Sphingobacteriales bacterium]|nr:MAG: hypothetical protein EOP56_10750 [Sphingobacteriales bacterium]